jgi:predicted DNA-binding transcriptional regulator AlpA
MGSVSVSIAEDEIEIGGRRYLNAQRLASILGVSVRTLSRWNAAGTGPRRIKVGRKVLFDLLKLPDWLTSRQTSETERKAQ